MKIYVITEDTFQTRKLNYYYYCELNYYYSFKCYESTKVG